LRRLRGDDIPVPHRDGLIRPDRRNLAHDIVSPRRAHVTARSKRWFLEASLPQSLTRADRVPAASDQFDSPAASARFSHVSPAAMHAISSCRNATMRCRFAFAAGHI
jgi:hypothetical protein